MATLGKIFSEESSNKSYTECLIHLLPYIETRRRTYYTNTVWKITPARYSDWQQEGQIWFSAEYRSKLHLPFIPEVGFCKAYLKKATHSWRKHEAVTQPHLIRTQSLDCWACSHCNYGFAYATSDVQCIVLALSTEHTNPMTKRLSEDFSLDTELLTTVTSFSVPKCIFTSILTPGKLQTAEADPFICSGNWFRCLWLHIYQLRCTYHNRSAE